MGPVHGPPLESGTRQPQPNHGGAEGQPTFRLPFYFKRTVLMELRLLTLSANTGSS
jgi:hypothetical protein